MSAQSQRSLNLAERYDLYVVAGMSAVGSQASPVMRQPIYRDRIFSCFAARASEMLQMGQTVGHSTSAPFWDVTVEDRGLPFKKALRHLAVTQFVMLRIVQEILG